VESPEKLGFSLLPAMFLSREQDALYQRTKWSDPAQSLELKDPKVPYGWHEYGAYVGFLPLILAVIGAFISLRRNFPLLAVGLCCLWIVFGAAAFPDLWGLLHRLPFYDSLRVPSRFLIGVLFPLSLFSGIGLSKLEGLSRRPPHKFLTVGVLAVVLFDLLSVAYPTLRGTFTVRPFVPPAQGTFRQRYVTLDLFPGQSRSSMYSAFLSNGGVLEGYEVIHVKKGNVRTADDPRYRGESYLVGTAGRAATEYFSPNKIRVRVHAESDGVLVLNQNYYRGWKVEKGGSRGAAVPFGGMIATPVTPQTKEAIFYYLPASFLIGCSLTLVSLFAGVFVVLRTREDEAQGRQPLREWMA
jgi:uncharacterized membrane protein YfhO